jgi:drug/metabolite transporter (DMT)-like permease
MTRIQANLTLLLAGAIWGMGFVAQSSAMEAIGPYLFIGLRFLIATLMLIPLALKESRSATIPLHSKNWGGLCLIGAVLFLGMASQQVGLLTTTVTNSGFLTGLYVVITPILTILFLRQKPHFIVWPASLISTAGIYLLSGGDFSKLQTGDLLTILCALFWAIQVILVGIFGRTTARPFTLSAVQFGVCALLGFIGALILEPFDLNAVRAAAKEILYAGIFSSGVAFTLQAVAQRYTTGPQAAIFLSSEALFAGLFGALFLGERISAVGYMGCALMFMAMILVEVVPAKWIKTCKQ